MPLHAVQCDFTVLSRPNFMDEEETPSYNHILGTAYVTDLAISDEEHVETIATLSGYLVRRPYCSATFLDSESADLGTVGLTILRGHEWHPRLDKAMEHNNCEVNFLVIDRLSIQESIKGHRVGLALARRFIQTFGDSCALCAVIAKPLQHIGELGDGVSSKVKVAAKRKLRAHYAKLGFTTIPRSDVMVLNLNYELPTFAEIGVDITGLERKYDEGALSSNRCAAKT